MEKFKTFLFRDLSLLLTLKIFSVSLIYLLMFLFLSEELFSYPDLSLYLQCSQLMTNFLYSKFLCALHLDYLGSMSSIKAILIAISLNIFIIGCFYIIFAPYLNRRGQLWFIVLLSFHPYLAVYFPRLYSDIFGLLGILLISYYSINNKKLDWVFITAAIILVNFRSALLPAFFFFALYSFAINRENKIIMSYSALLLLSLFLNYLFYREFSQSFLGHDYFSSQNKFLNPILLLGFRESVSNLGFNQLFASGQFIGIIYLIASIALLIIHTIGLIGLVKFSMIYKKYNLLSVFSILIVPLLAISHLRYLLPLMPILIFGCIWIFNKNESDLFKSN